MSESTCFHVVAYFCSDKKVNLTLVGIGYACRRCSHLLCSVFFFFFFFFYQVATPVLNYIYWETDSKQVP